VRERARKIEDGDRRSERDQASNGDQGSPEQRDSGLNCSHGICSPPIHLNDPLASQDFGRKKLRGR
jgi:hypothetical protein